MNDRAVLKPVDVAEMLGVTSGRVYQLIGKGIIPAVRIGGALRIPRAAWDAWLRRQQRNAAAAAKRARQLGLREPAATGRGPRG